MCDGNCKSSYSISFNFFSNLIMNCKEEEGKLKCHLLLILPLLLLFFSLQASGGDLAGRNPSPGDHIHGQNTFHASNHWEQPQVQVQACLHEKKRRVGDEGDGIMSSTVGSRPPSCEHKCERRRPCAASN